MGEKSILLSLVETVDFVDEEDCADLEIPVLFGALDDDFDIFFTGSDGGDFDKVSLKLACEDAG